ncbi:MAG: hypothetical protein Q8891_01540 [Bacteroidota bacterium]|nr:hypothetical protein [Bacteroidota bacterium]
MKGFLVLLSSLFLIASSCMAQYDILILKKNNRTQQSFFTGSEMTFTTATGFYHAYVTSIERDSVFLIQYDIRQIPTSLGVYVLDTLARYNFGINYHDITGFDKMTNKFDWSASGGALFGGGVLLTTVGLGTWIFTKPNTRYYASPSLVIGSAILAGIGYLMLKSSNKGRRLGKKYMLQYIKMK